MTHFNSICLLYGSPIFKRLINILFGKVWGLWYLKWGLPPRIKFCSFFSSALGILTTVDLVTSLDLQNCMTIKYCGLQHGQQPMDRETNCLTVISSSEGESRQHQWQSIEQQQVLAKSSVKRSTWSREAKRSTQLISNVANFSLPPSATSKAS